jgi:hypothetical protein
MLAMALILAVPAAFAQTSYHVPEDYRLLAKDDYGHYSSDFIAATNYLLRTPASMDKENRARVKKFVSEWIAGCPFVTIAITKPVVTPFLSESEPEPFLLYMAGWTRYALETNDTGMVACNIAGVHAVLDYYTNRAQKMKHNNRLDLWLQKRREGTLDQYVTELLQQGRRED